MIPHSSNNNIAEEEEDDLTCAICLDTFTNEHEIVILPCKNHSFHDKCIEMWLKRNSICPVCRFTITKENLAEHKRELVEL